MEQIFIRKKDVPSYLHCTAFYAALQCGDDSQFTISSSQYKDDDSLEFIDDLRALVSTLHFWGPFDISNEIIRFVLDSNLTHEIYSLYESFPEFTFLKTLADVNSAKDEEKWKIGISANNVEVVRGLSKHSHIPTKSSCVAAGSGSLECLQFIRTQWPSDILWDNRVARAAAENGHLNCLKFLLDNDCERVLQDLLLAAAGNGHTTCLQHLFETGAQWCEDVCTAAAKHGCLHCLTLAFEWRPVHVDTVALTKTINLVSVAAGNVDCIIMPRGTVLDLDLSRAAAKSGQLDSLRFLYDRRCPWDDTVCAAAARYGNFECLLYLRESGCPWRQREACRAAARSGSLACLQYTYHLRFRDDPSLCRRAAASGVVTCLSFLREEGKCQWNSEVCAEAAKHGHFECLQYARENGCAWDRRVCINAARSGHLSCLVYAHELGCPWDPFVASQAALHGHLHCLQYLHDQGCVLERDACLRAAEGGHLECLKYLLTNARFWTGWQVVQAAMEHGHVDCADFVNSFIK